MSINDYKTSLKNLIDATNDEALLKYWKAQLEWDTEHGGEVELWAEEWQAVQEGLTDYNNVQVLSLKEFIEKRSAPVAVGC